MVLKFKLPGLSAIFFFDRHVQFVYLLIIKEQQVILETNETDSQLKFA